MAFSLDEFYQKIVNLSDDEKISMAVDAERTVLRYLHDKFSDKDGATVYAMLIGTYVGIDGKISPQEYAFCKAVFELDLTPEEFVGLIKSTCTAQSVELMDRIIDTAPAEVKTAFVSLGLALCSIDDTLTASEQALLNKYLA